MKLHVIFAMCNSKCVCLSFFMWNMNASAKQTQQNLIITGTKGTSTFQVFVAAG